MINTVINGDSLSVLKTLKSNSVDCCISSPPYYALRDYGVEGQLGLEKTFHEYLDKLIEIYAEVKRVIKPTGTIWVNLGDSYSGNKTGHTDNKTNKSLKLQNIKKTSQDIQDKSLLNI